MKLEIYTYYRNSLRAIVSYSLCPRNSSGTIPRRDGSKPTACTSWKNLDMVPPHTPEW